MNAQDHGTYPAGELLTLSVVVEGDNLRIDRFSPRKLAEHVLVPLFGASASPVEIKGLGGKRFGAVRWLARHAGGSHGRPSGRADVCTGDGAPK
jgi:hypothetical protein